MAWHDTAQSATDDHPAYGGVYDSVGLVALSALHRQKRPCGRLYGVWRGAVHFFWDLGIMLAMTDGGKGVSCGVL